MYRSFGDCQAAREYGWESDDLTIKIKVSQLAIYAISAWAADPPYFRYWLLWRIQQAIPKATALATAKFATLRLRLIKVAARVIESAARIRVAFASACPDETVFKDIATSLRTLPT